MNLKNMFNFGYKRSLFKALIFYLLWCLLFTIISLILAAIFAISFLILNNMKIIDLSKIDVGNLASYYGVYILNLICLAITFLVIYRKKIYSFWRILFFLLAAFSCFFLNGALLGLIFTSILTMFPRKEELNINN